MARKLKLAQAARELAEEQSEERRQQLAAGQAEVTRGRTARGDARTAIPIVCREPIEYRCRQAAARTRCGRADTPRGALTLPRRSSSAG